MYQHMYVCCSTAKQSPPRGPILHPVDWRGVAGGGGGAFVYIVYAQYCPAHFPAATTALCWSRGASRYFRNHAGSCRGQREGAAQLRGGHQASTISTREHLSSEERRRQKIEWVGVGVSERRELVGPMGSVGGGGKGDRQLPRNSLQSRRTRILDSLGNSISWIWRRSQ